MGKTTREINVFDPALSLGTRAVINGGKSHATNFLAQEAELCKTHDFRKMRRETADVRAEQRALHDAKMKR